MDYVLEDTCANQEKDAKPNYRNVYPEDILKTYSLTFYFFLMFT